VVGFHSRHIQDHPERPKAVSSGNPRQFLRHSRYIVRRTFRRFRAIGGSAVMVCHVTVGLMMGRMDAHIGR